MYLNQITIVGYVAREAKVCKAESGKDFVRLAVAVGRGKDLPTDFFDVVVFEKNLEIAREIAQKGNLILVQGSMFSYKNDEGIINWNLRADKILLMKKKENSEEEEKPGTSSINRKKKKLNNEYEIYTPPQVIEALKQAHAQKSEY